MCEEGFIPEPTGDVVGEDPYACPEGQTLKYGKCVLAGEEPDDDGGCTAGPGTTATPAWLLLTLLIALATLRRRYG